MEDNLKWLANFVLSLAQLSPSLFQCYSGWLGGSSFIEIIFNWDRQTLRSYSIEVLFHWGCLPLRSSFIEFIFYWDYLPLMSSSMWLCSNICFVWTPSSNFKFRYFFGVGGWVCGRELKNKANSVVQQSWSLSWDWAWQYRSCKTNKSIIKDTRSIPPRYKKIYHILEFQPYYSRGAYRPRLNSTGYVTPRNVHTLWHFLTVS